MRPKKQRDAQADARRLLRNEWAQEVKQIRLMLELNEQIFNMTDDMDVTEYVIFEYNALQTRYRYLLRQIREADAQTAAAEALCERATVS